MTNVLIAVLIYLSFLFLWFVVNLIAYFLSVALKKKTIMVSIFALTMIVQIVVSWGIGIGMLVWLATLLFSGQIIPFLLLLFLGAGFIMAFLEWLRMPFGAIPAMFAEKVDRFDFEEREARAEILDKDD